MRFLFVLFGLGFRVSGTETSKYFYLANLAAKRGFNVHCFKQQISSGTISKVNPFESLSMLFSELHCWMKCPFLVSTWPVLKFYESLKFHCGTE